MRLALLIKGVVGVETGSCERGHHLFSRNIWTPVIIGERLSCTERETEKPRQAGIRASDTRPQRPHPPICFSMCSRLRTCKGMTILALKFSAIQYNTIVGNFLGGSFQVPLAQIPPLTRLRPHSSSRLLEILSAIEALSLAWVRSKIR